MVKIEQTGGRLTEEEILHGKEDAYGIYQINRKGAGRDYAFLSFDSLRSKGKVPERTEYQLVYSDILGADENRDSLFTKFNIAHPDDFTGHSLSVSDIILIKRNGKVNVSYVDMIGFVPLPDFYKEPSLRVVEHRTYPYGIKKNARTKRGCRGTAGRGKTAACSGKRRSEETF